MTRSFGLRAALSLLVLIAIAPVFAVVVKGSLSEQQGRLARTETTLKGLVELSAAHQERLIEGARQMLTAIAHSPPVYQDDVPACAAYMKTLQGQYPVTYGTFGVLDDKGLLTCRATAPATQVNSSDRMFFRNAVMTRRFAIGEFVVSRASGKPVLTFGLPVYREDDGALRGVVYVALDLAQADDQLRKLTIPPEMTLVVMDASGVVLASAGGQALKVGSAMAPGYLRRAIAEGGERFARADGPDGQEWLYAVRPVGREGEARLFVAGMASSAQVLASSELRLRQQLAALALITLVGAAMAWVFGDRVVARPLGRLLRRVDALAREETRLDMPPASGGLRELSELDHQFHDMARQLAERSVQRDGAMAEMAHQKTLLESVFASMAEGVLVADLSGRFLHINEAAAQILPGVRGLNRGKAPMELLPHDLVLTSLETGEVVPVPERPLRLALLGQSVMGFRYRISGTLLQGEEKVIRGSAQPMRTPKGELLGGVLVFSDDTAAWLSELALRDSEQRYRKLFESNPYPMWVYDIQTLRFLTVNDSAVAQYGYSREEFLAMSIAGIRPPEDGAGLRRVVDAVETIAMPRVGRHRLKDGRLIDVETSSHAMEYAGRPARMVLALDITLRLMAEEAMKRLNETLERRVDERTRELHLANHELESFSYSVSHDLRAPLQVIDGFGKALLTRHAQSLDDKARHYLDRIRENTRQMSGLIDDLLSLARVTRAEIHTERFNLAGKAQQIVERLRQRFPEREVAVDIQPDMPCRGDPRLLDILMENLIDNAWKFTSRTAGASIRVGSRPGEGGETVFFVADNGAGFDMAYASKLFNAFQRLHAVTEFEGTGIGLATVNRVVSRHGGRIWANAKPGEGATFEFSLPPERPL